MEVDKISTQYKRRLSKHEEWINDPETQRQKQYGAGSQNTKHKTKDWPTLTALRRVWRYQRGNQNP